MSNNTTQNTAVDQVAIKSGQIAENIMRNIKVWSSDQYEIRHSATLKLAEVIYDYETRLCENCKHNTPLNICMNPNSPAYDTTVTEYENFGCNKFERIENALQAK